VILVGIGAKQGAFFHSRVGASFSAFSLPLDEANVTSKITLTVDDSRGLYKHEVDAFVAACEHAGTEIDVKDPPVAPVQFASPASLIELQIDPQTLHLIFEYVAALVAVHKGTDYLGEFFKASLKKLGDLAGAKIADGFSALWHGIYSRVRAVSATREHTRVYFALNAALSGMRIEVDNAIFPSHIENWSKEDDTRAFWLLILRVLPIMREFSDALDRKGIKVAQIKAMIRYPGDKHGDWFWQIDVGDVGAFIVGPDGQLKTQYELEFSKKKPLASLKVEEIKAIVEAYAAHSQRGV
jgi:hypothetical protein